MCSYVYIPREKVHICKFRINKRGQICIFKNLGSNDNKANEGLKMKIKEVVWVTLARS